MVAFHPVFIYQHLCFVVFDASLCMVNNSHPV